MNSHPDLELNNLQMANMRNQLCYYRNLTVPNLQNKFIYVKQDFVHLIPPTTSKVLVNPHFRKKVYINPQFNPQNLVKPKIHVNPNVLKNLTALNNVKKTESVSNQTETVIATRTKLVRVPVACSKNSNEVSKEINSKRRNSINTKYRIVRSSNGYVDKVKSSVNSKPACGSFNKFKLDKRGTVNNTVTTVKIPNKKKYVYVNRFLTLSVMAKNVLLKQNNKLKKTGFVNINGMLYKTSPNSLKKEVPRRSNLLSKSATTVLTSKYKLVRKSTKISNTPVKQTTVKKQGNSNNSRRSIVKKYKIIRSKCLQKNKVLPSKLKKSNVPCPVYRKYGKCKGKDNGSCILIHNPDQIALCTKFLQGACVNKNCRFSHKVSHEKMPTCKYYLEGLCSKDDCPYLHVKISVNAEICKDFLEGFCKQGAKCNKRHQYLCPVFEKNESCMKRKCPYPHGNAVRQQTVLKSIAKKFSKENKTNKKLTNSKKLSKIIQNHNESEINSDKAVSNRYYNDLSDSTLIKTQSDDGNCNNFDLKCRPKLGELPSFIPIDEDTA